MSKTFRKTGRRSFERPAAGSEKFSPTRQGTAAWAQRNQSSPEWQEIQSREMRLLPPLLVGLREDCRACSFWQRSLRYLSLSNSKSHMVSELMRLHETMFEFFQSISIEGIIS